MKKIIITLLALLFPTVAFAAFPQNLLLYFNNTNLAATGSPTVGYITATSSTASVFQGGIQLPSLTGKSCIGTDANGNVQTGTCTGGGGGSGLASSSSAWTFGNLVVALDNGTVKTIATSSLTGIPNASLANSTISGVALGSNLNSLSHDTTLNGTSYNGSASVSNWGLNLANANSWTANQSFSLASTTELTLGGPLYDMANSNGTAGYVLMSSGGVLAPRWVATTTFSAPLSYSGGAVSCPTCNTSNASVSSIGTTWPISGGTITTTGTLTWDGLATSSAISAPQVLYATGVKTFQSVATTSLGVTAPITFSGTLGSQIGGGAGNFGCTTASSGVTGCLSGTDWNTFNNKQATIGVTWPITLTGATVGFNGLSTSSALVNGNLLYGTGVNTVAPVATGTITCTGTVSCGAGSYVVGSNLTITGSASSAAGTWSTTTSQVSGELINYPNNNTDIVTVGGNSTTTAKTWIDPNQPLQFSVGSSSPWAWNSFGISNKTVQNPLLVIASSSSAVGTTTELVLNWNGNLGLSTTSPWTTLSVTGSSDLGNSALAGYFTATTSTASSFPYASTTAISATTASTTNQYVSGLGTAAGTFVAADSTGKLIATTTPSSSSGKTIDYYAYATSSFPAGNNAISSTTYVSSTQRLMIWAGCYFNNTNINSDFFLHVFVPGGGTSTLQTMHVTNGSVLNPVTMFGLYTATTSGNVTIAVDNGATSLYTGCAYPTLMYQRFNN